MIILMGGLSFVPWRELLTTPRGYHQVIPSGPLFLLHFDQTIKPSLRRSLKSLPARLRRQTNHLTAKLA